MSASLSDVPRTRHPLRDPLAVLGLVLVVSIVFVAIASPWLAPYNPSAIAIRSKLQGPSAVHLLGTDHLGRDVFSRVVAGARVALETAFSAVALALAIGGSLGLAAGYGPRWLDYALLLVFDSLRAFPTVMLALALVTLIGPSLSTVVIVAVASFAPGYGRIVRTQTQVLKRAEFVLAERSLGASTARILAVHIVPNLVGPLFILASMDIPSAIAIEAGLSFLGFGVRPPTPSWGTVLNDGFAYIGNTPWIILAGGLPLVLSTIGFTFLGEGLRDAIDPRLRKAV